ncbi:NAD(P)-dependent oxidoreductase [Actinoplanes sp. ATCC 53533]|uniref:NAD-dependent epimerase/dehydratase family protein n=1 Tax=Actinoplanes sp. ATCC 53533 TaxID=1288362 RepID=UPI000F78C3AD|nr:NAD(P)-dependent oxidoreductase [Actinoplanes sp. ATCC 53533]RSM51182.1 NAD(P)-dependent oxidoreductase [Actinoplanes sp. ATCC 53533]
MRVLVAGATGVLGRPLLQRLRARGHQVTAMVRTASRAPAGDTVVADGLDPAAVSAAVRAARPDVVVHQMTALRGLSADAMSATARLRAEGTANLIAAGVKRLVAQSIAFAAAPSGGPVVDEDAPLYREAPDPAWAQTVHAVAELERLVLGLPAGTVVRHGILYGPGTAYAPDGPTGQAVFRGRLPLAGDGTGITSFVHVEDAAAATVAAVESAATGVFHITDDDPAPAAVWLPALAERLGGPPPRAVPAPLAARLIGWFPAFQLTEMRGAANDRARAELGWKPARPSWRTGLGTD